MTLVKQWTKPVLIISVSFLIAWLLPSGPVDPWEILSLKKAAYMVFALAFIQAFGSAMIQLLGNRKGAILTGFFGGLISSTATTVSLARKSKVAVRENIGKETLTFLSATIAMLIEGIVLLLLGTTDIHLPLLLIFLGPILMTALIIVLIHKKDDRVRKEFEKWAVLAYSDNRAIINEKKGADKGIDGVAFVRKTKDDVLPVIISVKSGHIGRKEMGELRGTIEREDAASGIMIMRHPPTKPMIQEAKEAGKFKPEMYPAFDRLQIVTVQEILDGARMNLPLLEEVTKKAQKAKTDNQPNLLNQ